jgi:ABC-2 type transport system permease protein
VLSILKKEIVSYLSSLVAYITIGVFLLVLGLFLWVFPDSSILNYGFASMESLFTTAPFLFMFLVPAITMRSLAEERKEGTFELLLTRPLTDWQIVVGKYLASVVIVFFALVPTIVYYYSVYSLGSPQGNIDTGGVIGSYIGLFLLGGCFCAIGIFASSISKNQIIAFTIAVFLCFFFYSGFDSLSQLLSLQGFDLESFGITNHYQSVSRGVLDTRDLVYFIIIAGLFLSLTLFILIRQRQKSLVGVDAKFFYSTLGVLLGLSIISGFTFTRFDFTKEKRFTISVISREIMGNLKVPVRVAVYLQGENFPGGMKRLQRATRDMLSDLQAYSHSNLKFKFIDPLKGLSQEDQQTAIQNLEEKGITPNNLSVKTDDGVTQKLIVPAALLSANNRQIAVNLLQTRIGSSEDEVLNNSIENLEYAFSSAIKKISSGGKPIIGFTEGHHELSNLQLEDAMKSLEDGYTVGRVNLNAIPFDSLMNFKLIIIPKPDSKFSELEKFKIDQFVMRGGRVVWAIDQVNAELDSMRRNQGEEMAFAKQLDIDDQLFTYGVRINYDLLADMSCSPIPLATGNVGGQAQIQLVPWLYYPLFIPSSKHPLVKNLDAIRSEFASTIDTIGVRGVKKTIILKSSPFNKKLNVPHIISLQAVEQEPTPKEFNNTPKNVAVLLEGKFTSDFLNRPNPAGLNEKIAALPQSVATKMLVISDGDVLKNQLSKDGSPYPLGYDHYVQRNYGNKNFLLNIADYMTDDSGLIALRTKEIKLRLLNRAQIRTEKLYWQLFNNLVPLALLFIFAIFQHYVRRRKYAR